MTTLNLPGSLPPLDWPPVATPWYQQARPDIALTVATSSIATVSGPSGTGKTTTVVACVEDEKMDLRYADLTHGAGVKDILVNIHEALHGPRRASQRDARKLLQDIVNTLAAGGRGVIADEVHYSAPGGMLTLAQVWERVKRRNGCGFPLFLIGATVQEAISSRNDELISRVEFPIRMDVLSTDDAIATVQAISPRCAATPVRRLAAVDKAIGHGNLRAWSKFIRYVERDQQRQGQQVSAEDCEVYVSKHRTTRAKRAA